MHARLLLSSALVLALSGCPSKGGGGGSASTCPAPVGTAEDADADLLTAAQEAVLGTDPGDADTDGDGFGDYAEYKSGTDPLDDASAPSGQVASVREITSPSELIGGPAAQGQLGDWLLENDRIRAIVQRPGVEQMQVGKFGGNLIDADVIRTGAGVDRVGSVFPVLELGSTSYPDRAIVVNDGSDGGPAILRTCGEEAPFEYLNLSAITASYGLGIEYDTNLDRDLYFSNDYVLAPGSNVVEIITTVANHGATFVAPVMTVMDSGGAEEVFLTNYQGFGALGFSALLEAQPPVRYTAFLGSGATWGYVAEAEPNAAINLFGITAVVPGFQSPLSVITSNPDDGPGSGLLEFKKGKRVSWRRGIVVTDGSGGTEPVSAEYVARHEPTATLHTGNVGDAAGPVAGARVVVLRRGGTHDRAPVVVTESDANGDYSVRLPDGDYYVTADVIGRDFPVFSSGQVAIDTLVNGTTIAAAELTLTASSLLPDITFDEASFLQVDVTDAATLGAVPAKVTVVGTDPSPGDSIFRDQKDRLPSAVSTAFNSMNGSFVVPLEPGDYDVYASRGMEWSLAQSPITVVAGASTSASLVIGRVVDTPNWISGDFHVHMMNSPDSGVTVRDRVVSGAAEGLDVIVATDHDYVTDLTPVIGSLGLESEVATSIGDEISTTAIGHFISFPLTVDPASSTGGSYAWTGPAGALNSRTPEQIFTDIDTANPGSQVSLVCHPRGDNLTAYFDAAELSTLTLATERDPEEIRIPRPEGYTEADTRLFYSGFDAQEVMNGSDETDERRHTWMNDVFSFLSHGLTVAAIGDSDTHSVFSSQLGWPRTYVEIQDDDPATFAANQEEFATSIKDGRAYFTSGPQIRVTVTGDDTGTPGDLVLPRTADDMVEVQVELEMPDWIEVDTLRLFLNTPNTGAPAGASVEVSPAHLAEHIFAVTTTGAGMGLFKNVYTWTTDVAVPTNGDAWLVVTASSTQPGTPTLFPVVPKGSEPFALANAVYLDGNRNGTWEAPGNVTAGAFTARPDVRVYEPDEVEANLPDVRDQFQRLSAGGENH